MLLPSGCDPFHLDEDGHSALYSAVMGNQSETVAFLIDEVGLDVDAEGGVGGWTVLHYAAANGMAEMAALLAGRADLEAR